MNIDNTVLFEILNRISQLTQKQDVWHLLISLIGKDSEEAASVMFSKKAYLRKITDMIDNSTNKDGESKLKTQMKNEQAVFSTGSYATVPWLRNKKGNITSAPFSWWPNKLTGIQQDSTEDFVLMFNKAVEYFFLWHVEQYGEKYVWGTIENVCNDFEVDKREVKKLKEIGNASGWIKEMIALCMLQADEEYVTQRFIKEKRKEGKIYIGAKKNSPIEFFNDLGYMPSIKCGLPSDSLSTLEGKILKEPHLQFKPPVDPKNWSSVSGVSAPLIFSDKSVRYIPYIEFIGSPRKGHFELIEGKNFSCEKVSTPSDVKKRIIKTNYSKAEKDLLANLASKGYTEHPPLMWLDHLDYSLCPTDRNNCSVKLYLGTTNYIEHRIYQDEMAINDELMDEFVRDVDGIRSNAENKLVQRPWTSCGGGCWIIVTDGSTGDKYIMVSYRNPAKVDELVNTLSYSSSGSFEYADANPAQGMMREIEEELGLIVDSPQDLVLISLGVDVERYIVQFSYVWETDLTIQEIDVGRKTLATTPGEQSIFYIPFTREAIEIFVQTCAFEPGAAYSLLNLAKKHFS